MSFVNPLEPDEVVDCRNLWCPEPARQAERAMDSLRPGQILKVLASDPMSRIDIPALARLRGYDLLDEFGSGSLFVYYLRKIR